MSNELIKAKTQAVLWRAKYLQLHAEAYPDIGMGKSWAMCVTEAAQALWYDDAELDLDKLKGQES